MVEWGHDGYDDRGYRRCEYGDEERLVAEHFLDLTADHAGEHHVEAHQRGAESVMRRAVWAGGDLLHHVDDQSHRAEAPEEFFDGNR